MTEDGGAAGGAKHVYRSFIKTNFAAVKSSQPPGAREALGIRMGEGGGI